MRFVPFIAAAVLLLTACGDGDEQTRVITSPVQSPQPAASPAAATSPQRYYLSPYALICPTRSAVEETLDYLRKVLGEGELRKNCTFGGATGLTEVLVVQDEVTRLGGEGEPRDQILAWKSVGKEQKGWSPLPFLATKVGGFYPLALTGASEAEYVMAFTELEDLRAMLSLEAGTAEYNDRIAAFRKQQLFSQQGINNRDLEVMALDQGTDHLGSRLMLAQWRYQGQKAVYWSRAVDLFATDSARSRLADRLGGR